MQEFGYYCDRLNRDRENIAPAESTLESIKSILISAFGIKFRKKPPVEEKVEGLFSDDTVKRNFNSFSFTTKEKRAWLEAKMPEPSSFLREYRKNHGN